MQSSAQHQSEYEKGKLVVWTGFSSCSATDKHLKRFTGDSGWSDAKFFVFLHDFSFFYPQVTYPKPERCFFQICTGQPYPDFLSLCQYTAPALGTAWSLFWRWQPALGETSMSFPATLAKKKFSCHPRSSVWGVFFFEKCVSARFASVAYFLTFCWRKVLAELCGIFFLHFVVEVVWEYVFFCRLDWIGNVWMILCLLLNSLISVSHLCLQKGWFWRM